MRELESEKADPFRSYAPQVKRIRVTVEAGSNVGSCDPLPTF